MNKELKLKELYENELKPQLSGMEAERKEAQKWKRYTKLTKILIIVLAILAAISYISVLLFFDAFRGEILAPILVSAVIFSIAAKFIVGIVAHMKFSAYRKKFKSEVMTTLVSVINPAYKYDAKKYVPKEDFLNSKIIRKPCDLYKGDDYIGGVIDKTPFQFSEIDVASFSAAGGNMQDSEKSITEKINDVVAQQSESEQAKMKAELDKIPVELFEKLESIQQGQQKGKKKQVFKGLFFVAEFNKHLNESSFVVPEKTYTNMLGKEKEEIADYGKLVKLENPEFEKIFSVYGSSQQEARYILTPAMMEAMLSVYRICNLQMLFSFIGSKVYCAVPIKKDLFEPTIDRGVKYSDIEEIYMLLSLIETIITEMNLNTRIWTKM